ncbi:BT4734/BF3469 family protein [Spirosoma fluminis]
MKNLSETIISQYESMYGSESKQITVGEALERIKNGNYGDMIKSCRKALADNDLQSYKRLKSLLPAITFSGTFGDKRKNAELLNYSSMMVLDIDSLNTAELEIAKSNISRDKHIYALWESPSGKGLKILLPVCSTFKEHKMCFDSLAAYFQNFYQISIDKSGSDICRLCFYSHDNNILIKETCEAFDYNVYPCQNILSSTVSRLNSANIEYKISEKRAYHDTLNRNNPRDRHTISSIIRYLRLKNLSITTSYENWYRVALAIADTFTLDIGSKYYLSLCELDGELHDEYKSRSLLEYCYRHRRQSVVKFATIIYLARLQGFKKPDN